MGSGKQAKVAERQSSLISEACSECLGETRSHVQRGVIGRWKPLGR